jgi:hypothetical protein
MPVPLPGRNVYEARAYGLVQKNRTPTRITYQVRRQNEQKLYPQAVQLLNFSQPVPSSTIGFRTGFWQNARGQ